MTIAIANQWAGSYFQPVTPPCGPAMQSVVIQLDSGTSVGGGTGTSTAGNWLFAVVGWQQDTALPPVTFGVGDDVHSWWRPGPVSTSTGKSRAAIWYTPNIARQVNYVYVPPDGAGDGVTVLVAEVSGLGPWDTVTGTTANYAAAAKTLAMSLGAPSGSAFTIGTVSGDNASAGQAFSPAGWTGLHTVSVTNGTDTTCDSEITSAYIVTSSSVSVSGSASTAEDLSGAILQVLATGTSPIPAGHNPSWPYVKFEMGLGSGFQTPLEGVTWTDFSSRLWSWDETTGIQYQLGAIQATDLTITLDNYDNLLSPEDSSSPYYGDITTGTPARLRMALGTYGGVAVNRWYVFSRNLLAVPERISDILRLHVSATATDGWFALSSTILTPYRNQVYADGPYAWWPCDDAPLIGGVLPVVLVNAAANNSNVLNIAASPNGATLQAIYSTGGTNLTTILEDFRGGQVAESIGTYTVGADQGWMWGDPQSANSNFPTGNPQSLTPGSAAVQFTGQQGNTGSYGWFLYCNDSGFPALSGGATVEAWFNYAFLGGPNGLYDAGNGDSYDMAQQPVCPLTIWEIATGSHPVAVLQLDTSGHLDLITYNGSTGTSNSIYTSSDLRVSSWVHVAVTMTATTWAVYVNGGLTAAVSGTATGMTSAWTWLIANGDLAANGGSSAGTGLVHGGNAEFGHIAVYPYQLDPWRILAHYWAAVTGGGQIPPPTAVSISPVLVTLNPGGSEIIEAGYTQDGTAGGEHGGGAGYGCASSTTAESYAFSALAAAVAGSYTSGPAARATITGIGASSGAGLACAGNYVFVSWSGLAPAFSVYTAAEAGAETQASSVVADSDTFTSGYGSGATDTGPGSTGGATGASPPATGSSIGDLAGQRIERLLQSGQYTVPLRAVDPAVLLVQAPGSEGAGLQAGQAAEEIQQSDGGMLYIDNLGWLTYWSKAHLASQYSSPVWLLGPSAGEIPYYREAEVISDPQRLWNAIAIQPFAPDGSQLPLITPADATATLASIDQAGAQPLQITSWLQSTAEMQSQANWLLTEFGVLRPRAQQVKVDASSAAPANLAASWQLFAGCNVGDVVHLEQWQIGGGGNILTLRVTSIRRHVEYGTDGEGGSTIEAATWLTLDFEPSSYWS